LNVEFEKNGGIVHGVEDLGFFGESLGYEGGFWWEDVDMLIGFIECRYFRTPGLIYKIYMTICSI
jgi:hypothetical protein